jgi:hypothetical protein
MLGRRLLAAAAMMSAAFVAVPCPAQDVAPLPDPQELSRYGMTRSWHTQVSILGREKVVNLLVHEGTVAVDQGDEVALLEAELRAGKRRAPGAPREFKRQREALLFVATDHGILHCLEADTGRERWFAKIGLDGDITHRPAITDKYIYAVSGTKLLRIDKATGRTLIERELTNIANASPAANANRVYVPAGNSLVCYEVPDPNLEGKAGPGAGLQGELFVRDEVDGGKRFNVHLPPGQNRRFEKMPIAWLHTLNVAFNSAPILFKNDVVACASDGTMTSYKQEYGERNWIHNNGHSIIAPLGVMNNFVYLASSDFAVYCIDIRNGRQAWRFPSGFPVLQQPVPFSTEVLVLSEGGGLTALDNKFGVPIWTNDAMRRLVAVSKEHVFAADRHNVVQVLRRKTGGVLGSLPLSSFTVSPLNQFNDRLYLASPEGQVLCLHETSSPQPFLHPQTTGIEDEAVAKRGLAEKIGEKAAEVQERPKVIGSRKKKKEDDGGEEEPPAKGKGKKADEGSKTKKKKSDDDDF